jgi:hypothetical protein
MATIDASGLSFTYNAFDLGSVAYTVFGGSGSNYLSWNTGSVAPYYRITALSYDNNVSISPLGGTIDAVNITNEAFGSGLSITGLQTSLTQLIDTANSSLHHEKFWEKVLAGATTVILPSQATTFNMMGDFVAVNTGQTLTGAADRFTGNGLSVVQALTGDALRVDFGATLNGGADIFDNAAATILAGDAGGDGSDINNSGTVNGGADRITLNDLATPNPSIALTAVVGDVYLSDDTSIVRGGADVITLRNFIVLDQVAGDGWRSQGTATGGVDTILVETTIPGRILARVTYVQGDFSLVSGSSSKATGGKDSITLNNVSTDLVSGDFRYVFDSASSTGGDDTIIYRGSFAQTPGASSSTITPIARAIVGDAETVSGSNAFKGGNDTIRLVNVVAQQLSGDVIGQDTLGLFTGGNDYISYTSTRTDVPVVLSIVGDASSTAVSATGGNDRLFLDIAATGAGASVHIVGDSRIHEGVTGTTLRNGNDTIAVVTISTQHLDLFGDGDIAEALGGTVIDGDDTITGGGGNDTIFGDTRTILVTNDMVPGLYTGGDDVLDGRGGNDTIDGGAGIDTVVFGLDIAVRVDLNGIPNSAAAQADWIEAVGQGNDQLRGIENVTGSSRADVIIGNAQANVINGMAGADRMAGGAGNDTYHVDTAGDITTENANAGTDLVISTVSRTLSAHIENLTLVGSAALQGNGNTLANLITGNSGNNVLRGYEGSDTLNGGAGEDILAGGTATDFINPGSDSVRDIIRFGAVAESTGSQRDIITGLDLTNEDRLDFTVIPTAIAFVGAGALSLATFNTNLASAVNAALAVNGAVLFDPSGGDLNVNGHLYVVVDANGDGSYTANQDYVVQIINSTGFLTLDDFI